jgi:hypothetical protein
MPNECSFYPTCLTLWQDTGSRGVGRQDCDVPPVLQIAQVLPWAATWMVASVERGRTNDVGHWPSKDVDAIGNDSNSNKWQLQGILCAYPAILVGGPNKPHLSLSKRARLLPNRWVRFNWSGKKEPILIVWMMIPQQVTRRPRCGPRYNTKAFHWWCRYGKPIKHGSRPTRFGCQTKKCKALATTIVCQCNGV